MISLSKIARAADEFVKDDAGDAAKKTRLLLKGLGTRCDGKVSCCQRVIFVEREWLAQI
jgi:hypothetical protein